MFTDRSLLLRSRVVALVGLILATLISVVSMAAPVSAELSSSPTTGWGVVGLGTNSQTDTIASEVWAIEQIGSTLYVGGRFLQVTNGVTTINQPYLAAFDATTGVHLPGFAPQLNNAVYALEASPDGSKLFVGGAFSTVNGVNTSGLAGLDPTTGAPTSWSGRIGGYNLVRGLDLVGDDLYVVGGFTSVASSIGNNAASRAARFDWQTGAHDPAWFPTVTGGSIWGVAASATADRVYFAGYFTSVNGVSRPGGFAAVNQSNAANSAGVQPFKVNTQNTGRQYLYDVVTVNGLVFAGGSEHFVQVLNEADLSLRYFHMSQPSRGDYQDLEVAGNRVFASCHCRLSSYMESATGVIWWGTPPIGQSSAAPFASSANSWATAFNASTGLREPSFVPNINSSGAGPWALHGSPDGCLWLGGNITQAAGVTQYNISRLCDPANQDTIRPSTPTNPVASNLGPDSVTLTWGTATDNVGVVGYRLYDDDTEQVVADVPTTSITLNALAPATYNYYVRAYDAAGNVSYRTGPTTVVITGAVPDTIRPSTPTKPVASNLGPDSVTLTWGTATDNVGVVGYRLYDDDTEQVVADIPTTSITLNALAPATYNYYVRAYDAAGNVSYRTGPTTVVITGAVPDTIRPSTPTKPVASNLGPDSVTLTWGTASDNVGVVGYRLYDDDTEQVVADVPTTSTILTGLAPATYNYYVRAYDAAGNVSYRTGPTTVVITGAVPDTIRPSNPAGLMVTGLAPGTVGLSWTAATDNVGVVEYRIYDGVTNAQVLSVTGTTGSVTGLAAGSRSFYVRAVDAAGNVSYRSNIVTAIVP